MKRKILALLLCFAMLFSLAPAGAFAEDEVEHYGVWVNGEEFTSTNTQITCGEGTASYDPVTNTVTLDNAVIKNSYTENGESFGIYSSGDLVVKLVGKNEIEQVGVTWYAIYGKGNIAIEGNGKLKVSALTGSSRGIFGDNVTISVGSEAQIEMMVSISGIQCKNTIISGEGTVNVTSKDEDGIRSGNVTISGSGNITFTGHDSGINAYNGDVTISGSGVVRIVGTGGNGITLGKATWVTQNYNLILSGNSGIVTISGGVGENTVGVSFGENNQGQVLLNGTASSITLKGGAQAVRYNGSGSGSLVAGTRIGDYDVTGGPAEASVVYTLKAAAHTHTYGEWVTIKEPTETTEGSKECTCSVCGDKETATIPVLSHIHAGTLHSGTPATCSAAGVKDYYTCTCGKAFEDEACTNKIENLDVWKAEGGNGYIVPKGHTEVVDEAVEATCTATGLTAGSHCSVCDTVLEAQTTVAAKGHTEVIDEAVAATCTKEGKSEGKHCSVCGEVVVAQETVKALGHKWGDWAKLNSTQHELVCANDATHKETANHSFTGNKCDVCGYTKSSGGSSSGGGGTYAGPTTSTTTVVKPALTMELQIGNKSIKVNDKTYTYDVAPFIAGDRTMVPVRVIMETLGAKVDWNEAARSVTITLDGKVMTMTIGKEIPGYGSAPVIRNDRTYVPIRYIMENTGAEVKWIAATGEITITK